MNFKLNKVFIYITLYLLNGCQNDINTDYLTENDGELNIDFKAAKDEIHTLANKIQNLSFHKKKSHSNHSFSNTQRNQKKTSVKNPIFISLDRMQENLKKLLEESEKGIPTPEIDEMPTPFLPPNGNSKDDLFFKNMFFNILEMQETLRELIEGYNKLVIRLNLNILKNPNTLPQTDDLILVTKFRQIAIEEIAFVKEHVNYYNQRINLYFPDVNHQRKMSGYYSFDNSHISYNESEFSIEDISNFSYSYHRKLITKDILKEKNAKLHLHQPEVGKRRGTVFLNSRKPNVIRGSLGNDFGSYSLGVAIGMAIEYAITGKIYHYRNVYRCD